MMTDARKYSNAKELLDSLVEGEKIEFVAPIDIEKIVKSLGLKLIEEPLSDDVVGEIMLDSHSAVIKINPAQNSYRPRRRFTIAHELAHYILHLSESKNTFIDTRKTMSRSESYWDIHESEANAFAAQLLMPKSLILKEGKEIISSYTSTNKTENMPKNIFIEKMSNKFNVSSMSMEYRLKNLGIISS